MKISVLSLTLIVFLLMITLGALLADFRPVEKDGKTTFINEKGEAVDVSGFSEGLASVILSGGTKTEWGFESGFDNDIEYAFIDTTGEIKFTFKANSVSSFHNGRARYTKWVVPEVVKDEGDMEYPLYGFIDKNGEVINEQMFGSKTAFLLHQEGARDFWEGLAAVWIEDEKGIGGYGFIDTTGKVVFITEYGDVGDFYDGLALAQLGYGGGNDPRSFPQGYLNKSGEMVIDLTKFENKDAGKGATSMAEIYEEYGKGLTNASNFSGGFAPVSIGGKWGFINKKGEIVIEPKFEEVNSENFQGFVEGYAAVGIEYNKWGYCNTKGEVVIPFQFITAREFSGGLAAVRIQTEDEMKWGYIGINGDFVIEPIFDGARSFHNGTASVGIGEFGNRSWGEINKSGEYVWEPNE